MTQQANFFKLGVFIIGSFFLCAGFLIALGAGEFLKKEVLVETYFNESVQGLNIGSPVKFKGITIGSVKTITSAARTYDESTNYIQVTMALADDVFLGQTGKTASQRVQKAIENGLTIHLAFMGLTGAAFLETDYSEISDQGKLNFSWKPEHMYIPSRQSSMKRLSETLNHIMDTLTTINIQGIVTDLHLLLRTLNDKAADFHLKEISLQTESLIKEIRESNQTLHKMVSSDAVRQFLADARASVSNFNTILENAKPPIKRTLADFELTAQNTKRITQSMEKTFSDEISSFSSDLTALMESLDRTAGMLEKTVWLNSDQIDTVIENLKITTQNLKYMSMEIRKYPGRLLFENPPDNPAGNP